jgi:hypothetical protein
MASRVSLNEVDGVEIISLTDNTTDFLSTIEKEVHQVREVRRWLQTLHGKGAKNESFAGDHTAIKA